MLYQAGFPEIGGAYNPPMAEPPQATQRLDKWLWAARFFKTRGNAAAAITGGKVHVDDCRVKPSRLVRPGTRVSVRKGALEWEVVVQGVSRQRRPATEAASLYAETPGSIERRERGRAQRRLAGGEPAPAPGRPSKRDRRLIARLKGK